jgi:hypothetical protein
MSSWIMAAILLTLVISEAGSSVGQESEVLNLGSRLELFVDHYLIDRLEGAQLELHEPQPAEVAIQTGAPIAGYTTVLKDGRKHRMYYDAMYDARDTADMTCYAESSDGITWRKPDLGLLKVPEQPANNVIITGQPAVSHTFRPFIDLQPGIPASERFKALGGRMPSRSSIGKVPAEGERGLMAFVSADGIRWKKLQDEPVIGESQYPFHTDTTPPGVFWSEIEASYVCYIRMWLDRNKQPACTGVALGNGCKICDPDQKQPKGGGVRWIGRTTSKDFVHWSKVVPMGLGHIPPEQYYTNETHPYFRAPHIYIALPTRFIGAPLHAGRRALTDAQLQKLSTDPQVQGSQHPPSKIAIDFTDTVLLTSRGGHKYDRTFMEAFIRPGVGLGNWTNRAIYAYANVVPTSETEMSLYMTRDPYLPSNHVRRYTLRTDGFASVSAAYAGGEMVTKPFTFSGEELVINYATSAGGSLGVEIQDKSGRAIEGYLLADADEIIGDEIERAVSWKGGSNISQLAGRAVRVRFVMNDADLYSMRFR